MEAILSWFAQQAEFYNVNPIILAILYIGGAVPFYLGIFLMLKGSGLTKIKWKDLRKMDFSKINLKNKTVIVGFVMYAVASVLAPIYITVAGRNLPLMAYIIACAPTLIGLVLFFKKPIVAFGKKIFRKKNRV